MPGMVRDQGTVWYQPSFIYPHPSYFMYDFVQPDLVGMGTQGEGTALPPFGSANTDRSYARVGADTDDNARDFAMISPSQPQNSSSCH
jgi:hypothetical protein